MTDSKILLYCGPASDVKQDSLKSKNTLISKRNARWQAASVNSRNAIVSDFKTKGQFSIKSGCNLKLLFGMKIRRNYTGI